MAERTPPRFWRSDDERDGRLPASTPEFAPGVSEAPTAPADNLSRRRFLSLLGASAALAATAGCGRNIDRGSIVPYTRRPEEGVPGKAAWYASSTSEGCQAYPLLVKTREHRPILIEGHDAHEDTRGAAPVRQQAELLGLYDPERLQGPTRGDSKADWSEAEAALLQALRGGPALLLTSACLSPSRHALLEQLRQALPALRVAHWEAAAPHNALAASQALFGAQLLPRLHLDKARVILTLEADLFAGDGETSRQIRGFAQGRTPKASAEASPATMNRLWCAESRMTLTGGKADERLRVKASRLGALGFALAEALRRKGRALPAGAGDLPGDGLDAFAQAEGLDPARLRRLADDLDAAGPTAVVAAGGSAPADAHAAALLLNRMLGAEGVTVVHRPAALAPLLTPAEMAALGQEMVQGRYPAVVLWNVNPAYDGPAGLDWDAALAACGSRFHIGLLRDESAAACEWILASHHWLECWGDQVGGLLQQPVVAPLFDTRQPEDLLLGVLRGLGRTAPAGAEEHLKAQWAAVHGRSGSPLSFDLFWHGALHDGWVKDQAFEAATPAFRASPASLAASTAGGGFELVVHADRRLLDGRGANNGWLQELPDPVTKCTWGNPLALSPADAKELGVKDGDLLTVSLEGASLTVPALVQPGQAKGCLSLALGYGRRGLAVAEGIGVNAFPLLRGGATVLGGATLAKAGGSQPVHTTQMHQLMEGRDIVRSLPVVAYAAGETGGPAHAGGHGGGHEKLPTGHDHGLEPKEKLPLSLYPDHPYTGHKWGMAIDLSACVGCGGCVTACQAENNIPVVGPERIDEGREMQWIRIDRYYEGDLDDPDMVFQPMLCQHCDHAPCENVCPVAATTHNEEGLNQMTYNRCVGTRYCANNCPYKVRRFNYFDYTSQLSEVLQMAANPEVSIRPRGVMEKCTFCVQRINEGKNLAKAEGRVPADGEIRPACEVACAAGAIVFGDLNADSRVAGLAKVDRRYKVLEELGVRPAVTYLAEVRNPVAAGGAHES